MWRVKKCALNMLAKMALPAFLFNNAADDELDLLFWALANAELTNVKLGKRTVCFDALGLHFEDIWISNRWYSWLKSGRVYKGGKLVFEWHCARPSAFVMWMFRRSHGAFEAKPKKQKTHRVETLLYEAAVESGDKGGWHD